MNTYQPVIGLEIHIELKTESGMFCFCKKTGLFGAIPNTHVCPVCLGLPGALPVPNRQAIEWTIKIGQALNCTINNKTKFDRKHYSYPDLPKGYQISQYDEPIAKEGFLEFKENYGIYKNKKSRHRINRVHLEEDTGKLTHEGQDSLIDFNRSGTALVEIVTEPDFESPDDVKMFLEELHTIIRYLDVSDADMEKGTMRIEPNISVRVRIPGTKSKDGLPNYKVEVKNINSFNFVKKAIEYEIKRHIELLEQGKTPAQETRGWDSSKNITYSQRAKEEAHDYRYFPDPDIPPLKFSSKYLQSIHDSLPELPTHKHSRFIKEYNLKDQDAFVITRTRNISDYFEQIVKIIADKKTDTPQKIVNAINNKKIPTDIPIEEFAKRFVNLYTKKEMDFELLHSEMEKVIAENPNPVADYKKGKKNAIMFLVGQVMRNMKGQADAQTIRLELEKKIRSI